MIWIHEELASGPTEQRWKDFDVFAYERTGGSRLLVALNNDPNGTHTIQVPTGFGPGSTSKITRATVRMFSPTVEEVFRSPFPQM
jgi:hypothetical protein